MLLYVQMRFMLDIDLASKDLRQTLAKIERLQHSTSKHTTRPPSQQSQGVKTRSLSTSLPAQSLSGAAITLRTVEL